MWWRSTNGAASTSLSDCKCEADHYDSLEGSESQPTCRVCPIGTACSGLGATLLETLEAGAGVAKVSWTPELRDAWTDVWVTVATTMKGDLYATSSK